MLSTPEPMKTSLVAALEEEEDIVNSCFCALYKTLSNDKKLQL